MTDSNNPTTEAEESFFGAYLNEDGTLTERGEWTVELGLDLLAKAAHTLAVKKGWYDRDRQLPEEISLMHSELSEALEEFRDDTEPLYFRDGAGRTYSGDPNIWAGDPGIFVTSGIRLKPEGMITELGDCVIRIADTAANPERAGGESLGKAVTRKHAYNATRPARHGGKKA